MSHQLPCVNGLYPLQVPTTTEQNIMSTFAPIFFISKCQVLLIIKIVSYLEIATKKHAVNKSKFGLESLQVQQK